MILEMFLWTAPRGLKTFGMKPDYAAKTATLAANQGLYNGFLSTGLFWGLLHPNAVFGKQIQLFFLGCVFVAGAYGGATVKPRIFLVQGVPAVVGLAAVLLV
jgi:putative membrane protein